MCKSTRIIKNGIMSISRIDYIKAIFSDIELKHISKISNEVEDMFNYELQQKDIYSIDLVPDDLRVALHILEEELRKVNRLIKSIKRKIKNNASSLEELQEHLLYADDLVSQIENIKNKLS